jgi:hypothetical protein
MAFRFRNLLDHDEDFVRMVWAATAKSLEGDGYWNGSSVRLRLHLFRAVRYVTARTMA